MKVVELRWVVEENPDLHPPTGNKRCTHNNIRRHDTRQTVAGSPQVVTYQVTRTESGPGAESTAPSQVSSVCSLRSVVGEPGSRAWSGESPYVSEMARSPLSFMLRRSGRCAPRRSRTERMSFLRSEATHALIGVADAVVLLGERCAGEHRAPRGVVRRGASR